MVANTLKKIRVLIVDDSAFMRKVLETILVTDENVQVVGHAKDGREAVRLSESLKPDVITMDINMPVMDGLAGHRRDYDHQSAAHRGGQFRITSRSGQHIARAGTRCHRICCQAFQWH